MCPDPILPGAPLPEEEVRAMNGVTLAYIGDAVYELLVRRYVLSLADSRIRDLHTRSIAFANATEQAEAAGRLQPLLSETERGYYLRGRNAHVGHTPKNKTEAQYHLATGLEALFGYLYLTGQTGRAQELFSYIVQHASES